MTRWVGVVVAGVLGLSACGGGGPAPKHSIGEIDASRFPAEVLGLTVGHESVKKQLGRIDRPYLDAVGLLSFRKDNLLQATLQVSRLNDTARWSSEDFRRSLASQILGTGAQLPEYRVGGRTVYVGGDARQTLAVWFDGRVMMLLVERADYDQPRALLRSLIMLGAGSS